MSWAKGREKTEGISAEKKLKNLNTINAILLQLSNNEDFQSDLKLPIVKKAIAHW